MDVRIIEVILNGRYDSSKLACTSWLIEDGCLMIHNKEAQEQSVFPLSSLLCFHVYNKPARTIEEAIRDMAK